MKFGALTTTEKRDILHPKTNTNPGLEPAMYKYLLILAVFTMIGFVLLNPTRSLSQKSEVLFSDDDADKLRYADSEWEKETIAKHEEALIARPTVIVEKPKVIDTSNGPTIITITPANVLVIFKQNDSTINLDSLDVWAEKDFFKKNVTKIFKPYIKANNEGAVMHVKSVHIPKGKYKIFFKIADINGQETTGKYRLHVK